MQRTGQCHSLPWAYCTFERACVNKVSWLLIRFAWVMVPIVSLINGVGKGDWPEAFQFALVVVVGLTPEIDVFDLITFAVMWNV